MAAILNLTDLNQAINVMEESSKQQYNNLTDSFEFAMESIKPANLVKSTISDIIEKAPIPETEAGLAIAAGAGLLSKKIVTGKSKNIGRSILGTLAQFVVTGGLSKKSDQLGRISNRLLKKIIN